jgi:hypothetical protein
MKAAALQCQLLGQTQQAFWFPHLFFQHFFSKAMRN